MWKSLKRANQSAASFMREILLANESTRIFRRLSKSNNRSNGFKRKSFFLKRENLCSKWKKLNSFDKIFISEKSQSSFLRIPPFWMIAKFPKFLKVTGSYSIICNVLSRFHKISCSMSKLLPVIFITKFIRQYRICSGSLNTSIRSLKNRDIWETPLIC